MNISLLRLLQVLRLVAPSLLATQQLAARLQKRCTYSAELISLVKQWEANLMNFMVHQQHVVPFVICSHPALGYEQGAESKSKRLLSPMH